MRLSPHAEAAESPGPAPRMRFNLAQQFWGRWASLASPEGAPAPASSIIRPPVPLLAIPYSLLPYSLPLSLHRRQGDGVGAALSAARLARRALLRLHDDARGQQLLKEAGDHPAVEVAGVRRSRDDEGRARVPDLVRDGGALRRARMVVHVERDPERRQHLLEGVDPRRQRNVVGNLPADLEERV